MEKDKTSEPEEKAEEHILLFVGGVPGKVTKDELRDYFLRYGEVVSVKVNKARQKKKPTPKYKGLDMGQLVQGHAYVKMKDSKVARALIEMQELPIDKKRTLHIEAAVARSEKKKYKQEVEKLRVFIGNLPVSLTTEMLKNHFIKFGSLKKIYKIYDHFNQVDKDYGYVIFQDAESATEVLQYDYHKVGNYFVRVAPFVAKSEQNSAKGGYPYSDQYPKNISVFDPNSSRRRFEAILGSDGKISKFRQEAPTHKSMGSYNYHQGLNQEREKQESQFLNLSEPSENYSPDVSQRDNFMEWNVRHWQEQEIQARQNSRLQIKPFQSFTFDPAQTNSTPTSPGPKESRSQFHHDASESILYLDKNTRIKEAKNSKMIGGLSIVEEKRTKSQHPERPNPKEQILNQSITNYRLNILKRNRQDIPQLQPPINTIEGHMLTINPQTYLIQKTETGPSPEVTPPPLVSLEPKALNQTKD